MKKITLFFCCISILIGAIVIIITSMLNEIMPKLGYMIFQSSLSGSFSTDTYKMNFSLVNIIAVVMILVGFIISVKLYTQPDDK